MNSLVKGLIVAIAILVEVFLLTLPGYCSSWWPVWAQVASLSIGIVLLAVIVACLAWQLENSQGG